MTLRLGGNMSVMVKAEQLTGQHSPMLHCDMHDCVACLPCATVMLSTPTGQRAEQSNLPSYAEAIAWQV